MKKTIKFLIITIIAILVFSGAVFAYLYFATDMLKSSNEMFEEYSSIMIGDITKILIDNDIKNYENKKQNNKYENSGQIEVALQLKNDEENESIDSKIVEFSSKVDNSNSILQEDIKLYYNDNVTLPVSIVRNNGKYAITSSEMMKAYAAVENTNLKEFFSKFGVDSQYIEMIPDKIEIDTDNLDLNGMTLKQEYKDIINKNISADFFSKEDSETKGYILKIPAANVKNIIVEAAKQMKNDEEILKIIKSIYKDEETCQEFIELIIKKVNELDEDYLNDKYLILKVYETKNGITTGVISFEEISCKIDTSSQNINITISNKEEEISSISLTKTNTENLIKYELNMSIVNIGLQNINLIEKAKEQANYYETGLETEAEENINSNSIIKNLINISYQIENINTDNPSEKSTIIYNNIGEETQLALGLEYTGNVGFNENIEITELNEENSVILNDLSRDTLTTTVSQIFAKVIELNNNKIIQAKQSKNKSIITFILENSFYK